MLSYVGGYAVFDSDGIFRVPKGKQTVRVLVVGGGAGGNNGYFGGGGSGRVTSAILPVRPEETYDIKVGLGGLGGIQSGFGQGVSVGNKGGVSSFDMLISAAGGQPSTDICSGGDGGSGGGAGGENCDNGGNIGGSDGSAGQRCKKYPVIGANGLSLCKAGKGGKGQGSFTIHFKQFRQNTFSAGEGGNQSKTNPQVYMWIPGSGGGGVLMNGMGPNADDGTGSIRGFGGKGFGAGGGAGGAYTYLQNGEYVWGPYLAGGSGVPGLVYVEWD